MNADQWVKTFTLAITFIQVIIWPLIVLIIVFYLRAPLKKFIDNTVKVSLKAGPIETVAESRQAIEIATSLGAAEAKIQVNSTEQSQTALPLSTRNIAKLVDQTVTPQAVQNLAGISILWVDDQPLNNTYARHALEALGIRFSICITTNDAIEELKRTSIDAVISDMGRPPDMQAGYTLLEKMQAMSFDIPFIIYAKGGDKQKNKEEAKKRGAYASADGPQDLYRTVVNLFNKPDNADKN